jgi:hypothetical protein
VGKLLPCFHHSDNCGIHRKRSVGKHLRLKTRSLAKKGRGTPPSEIG